LVFLALTVTLPQFAPFTAENDARDAVAAFRAIELRQRTRGLLTKRKKSYARRK
jgi:type II secretory pathway pseudopilin PulG